jgi:hypothetical protein
MANVLDKGRKHRKDQPKACHVEEHGNENKGNGMRVVRSNRHSSLRAERPEGGNHFPKLEGLQTSLFITGAAALIIAFYARMVKAADSY